MEDIKLLTVEEVARYLDVTGKTVRRLITDEKLAGIKVGREYRITKAALEKFLEQQEVKK